jgi:hypothetical protein
VWQLLVWSKALKARGASESCEEDEREPRKRMTERRKRGRKGRHNDKRARASETAYGCTGGERLWRVKPQERIWHETRPADHWGGEKRHEVEKT